MDITEFTNELLSNVHAGGDMSEPTTGADIIPEDTPEQRLDQLGQDLFQDMVTCQEMATKAAGRYSAFMLLKTGSVSTPEQDAYKENTEGSPMIDMQV